MVDNASTDGTAEALRRWTTTTPLTVLTLSENTGGAGGFHTGLAAAMDRRCRPGLADGRRRHPRRRLPGDPAPAPGRPTTSSGRRSSPRTTRAGCASRSGSPGTARVVHAVADVEARRRGGPGCLEGVVIPFNGVLVTRELVERIGLPREEFFIWGDDVEYLWRARAAGARVATVVGSRFPHPATDDLGTPMMFGRTTYNHSPSDLKHYCMCRNNVVNLRDYRGLLGVLAFVVKTLWFYTFTRRDLAPAPAQRRGDAGGVARATSPATGGSSMAEAGAPGQRRGRDRHLQPRRPARAAASTGSRPRPAARRGLRRRQRQHRPHRRGAATRARTCRCASSTARRTSAVPAASTSASGRRTTRASTGSG